jgi:hypothetical protein
MLYHCVKRDGSLAGAEGSLRRCERRLSDGWCAHVLVAWQYPLLLAALDVFKSEDLVGSGQLSKTVSNHFGIAQAW